MPEEFKPGCQRPAIKKPQHEPVTTETNVTMKEVKPAMVKVGKPAPDFTAPAFYNGKFMNIGLSEYKGKWVLVFLSR